LFRLLHLSKLAGSNRLQHPADHVPLVVLQALFWRRLVTLWIRPDAEAKP
jgi:hypothetical protein